MRNPGTIMGVTEDGSFAGSLSGGCIENAVVSEAMEVLREGSTRMVRYGAGSPYLDIKLPCGGGLDLHFAPLDGEQFAQGCLDALAKRSPFSIAVSSKGAKHIANWQSHSFDAASGEGAFGHWPAPQLQIVGHGAGVEALAKQARIMGCSTYILTPDERIIEALSRSEIDANLLKRLDEVENLRGDPWTATVFLFHDHDWEIALMQRALKLPHFYMGAMGGRKAHTFRSEALKARGVSDEQLATIRAPIGLFHSSRDPQTLALSTLAEVIRTYQDTDFEALLG